MPDTQLLDPLPNLPCVNLPLVHEYVDGTLDPATQRRVAAHLAGCAVCESERAFVVELRAQVADMPRLAPPDHLWESIAASLGAASDRGDDSGEGDPLPEWGTGTFGADVEPPVRATRRAPRWRGWIAGLSVSAAAAAVVVPTLIQRAHVPVVASRDAAPVTQRAAVTPPSTAAVLSPVAGADAHSANASHGTRATTNAAPAQLASATSSDAQPRTNPLLSDGMVVDGMMLTGVSLDRSLGSRQGQQAEVALEQEKLFQAEAAIASCEAALRENPNDPRVNQEYKRALEIKAHALEVIRAAGRSTFSSPGSPEAYPVSLEPAGSPRRW